MLYLCLIALLYIWYAGQYEWSPKVCFIEDVVGPIFDAAAAIAQRDGIEFRCSVEVRGCHK